MSFRTAPAVRPMSLPVSSELKGQPFPQLLAFGQRDRIVMLYQLNANGLQLVGEQCCPIQKAIDGSVRSCTGLNFGFLMRGGNANGGNQNRQRCKHGVSSQLEVRRSGGELGIRSRRGRGGNPDQLGSKRKAASTTSRDSLQLRLAVPIA